MHQSFVTMHPRAQGLEMRGVLTKGKTLTRQCGGTGLGSHQTNKAGSEMKTYLTLAEEISCGYSNQLSLQPVQGSCVSGDLLDQKPKSQVFPGPWHCKLFYFCGYLISRFCQQTYFRDNLFLRSDELAYMKIM